MNLTMALAWSAGVFGASLAATGGVLRILRRKAILDHPNDRSSHTMPTPRGGGIAVVAVLLAAWAAIDGGALWPVLAGALGLAAISWRDDLGHVPAPWRLLGQGLAVALVLAFQAGKGPYFGGLLPAPMDTFAAAFAWLWFINLFNFMDGIDGITGVQAACVGAGTALVALIGGFGGGTALLGLTAAAGALGFLWWNRPPARIFLGDVGSVPLGFLLGWLLLELAARGQGAAALILPLYYLADATVTVSRRALKGRAVWQAHREHFYQRAVGRGLSHGTVAGAVLAADLALVALAALAAGGWPATGVLGGGVVVAVLLRYLGTAGDTP